MKQQSVGEAAALTLAEDAKDGGYDRALLAVLPPGRLDRIDVVGTIKQAESEFRVFLCIGTSVREILHQALFVGRASLEEFGAKLPMSYINALSEIRADAEALKSWALLTKRWG